MIQNKQVLTLDEFDSGLSTVADILGLKKGETPNCADVRFTSDDAVEKRLGTSTMNTTAMQGTGGWAMFDFGASSVRWVVVASGTGLYASSNLCATMVAVGTTRTQTYQFFERSKNVLVATSDNYDTPLFWAGSAGTFFALLNASAPTVKYAINYQGFLILLNSSSRKRGFYYEDDTTQLTGDWADNFDLPSSADDEVTCAFVLNKRLYVSTRYKIFRVTFVGGNPDWSYLEVKDWGFVPRTVRKITLKVGEVVMGLDWTRKIRVFDGSDDLIASTKIERDNGISSFAMEKISYAGSGLTVSHAEVDRNENEYRLNVAIGAASSETTHAIVMNGETLAFYPFQNQQFQSMVMAESGNRLYLLGCDRTGRVHIVNSGNRDVATAIDEVYESPFLFTKTPGTVSKAQKLDLFFQPTSSGTMFFYDRSDFSSVWGPARKSISLITTNSVNQIYESVDVPSTHNVYQYKLSSSANTADPWRLTRSDFYIKGLGVGKGGA